MPFEGKIIWDGLVAPYNVTFGGGVRRDLNDEYRRIQERGALITTLTPDTPGNADDVRKGIESRNKKLLVAFQKELGKAGLTLKMMEQHGEVIRDFAQSYLLAQDPPGELLDFTDDDMKTYLDSLDKPSSASFKRFIKFLRDTDRLDYNKAEALLDGLKRQR